MNEPSIVRALRDRAVCSNDHGDAKHLMLDAGRRDRPSPGDVACSHGVPFSRCPDRDAHHACPGPDCRHVWREHPDDAAMSYCVACGDLAGPY